MVHISSNYVKYLRSYRTLNFAKKNEAILSTRHLEIRQKCFSGPPTKISKKSKIGPKIVIPMFDSDWNGFKLKVSDIEQEK